jgi:nitrate reductase cytochrome c-type subunit
MKRIMKKLMCMTIALLLVIFNMQGAFAQEDEASKTRINNQGRALENAAQIEKIIFGNAELEDSYAGLYLDENGNLVVNYVGGL